MLRCGARSRRAVTVTGVLVAPVDVITIVPLWVPIARPPMLGVTVIVDGAVPDDGVTDSQLPLAVAVQFSVPAPELVMLMVCVSGAVPPTVPVNVRLDDDVAMVPGAGGGGGGGGGADGGPESDPPLHVIVDAATATARRVRAAKPRVRMSSPDACSPNCRGVARNVTGLLALSRLRR